MRLLSICLLSFFLLACSNEPAPTRAQPVSVSQNALDYVGKNEAALVLTPAQQKHLFAEQQSRYFAPWQANFDRTSFNAFDDPLNIKAYENEQIRIFTHAHFWDAHNQPYSEHWLDPTLAQMDLAHFPNANQPAITLRHTALRLLPFAAPAYENPDRAGQGFPFDDLQVDSIWAGTPVRILQHSTDQSWSLVATPWFFGWVQSADLASVDADFIKAWQAHPWVTPLADDLPVMPFPKKSVTGKAAPMPQYTSVQPSLSPTNIYFKTKIGSFYPLLGETQNIDHILVPTRNEQGQAVLSEAFLPATQLTTAPFSATQSHFARVMNAMQGEPYRWGGLEGGRDCSSTMRDLFSVFGVWLPRSSGDQVRMGLSLSLANLTPTQRSTFIIKNAKPFATLLGYPGHITLYIGKIDDVPYVFQTVWGLHTYTFFGREGRAVIGKTVISPLNLGQDHIDTQTQLDKPITMAFLFS